MLYKNLAVNEAGHLTFGGYDTTDLAAQFGTPLMVMDESVIRNRCREYKAAVAAYFPEGSMPLYASKALSLKRIYEIMQQEQMGIDVVSSGELFTAVRGGFPLENAYFHGNSKTDADIAFAMDHGLGCFVCDNEDELNAINEEAGKRGIRQKILLRLTPGIDPHTHEKINTGRIDCKFGAAIETGQAEQLICSALSKENIELRGYHCHIGSQIFDHEPFCDAAVMMLEFLAFINEKHSFCAPVLNLGGGMGVPYTEKDGTISTLRGSSVGGGEIEIGEINGCEIKFSGKNNAVIVHQKDKPGVVATIAKVFEKERVNISAMNVICEDKGRTAFSVVEIDGVLAEEALEEIRTSENILSAMYIRVK